MLVLLLMSGCPESQTQILSDPYLTAKTVISQANIALSLADGIFQQWALGQADIQKRAGAQKTFTIIKTSVANGLQLALKGVEIAQTAKQNPDLRVLMGQSEEAWRALTQFLAGILDPKDNSIVVAFTPPNDAAPPAGGVSVKEAALRPHVSPLDSLPISLL